MNDFSISGTPLDDTASACNQCGIVRNADEFTPTCPLCGSEKGSTLVTQAPAFGITAGREVPFDGRPDEAEAAYYDEAEARGDAQRDGDF